MARYDRKAAVIEGEFAVFLVGARINRWWAVPSWWWTYRAFRRIVQELESHEETGYLGGELWPGRTTIMVQYWRSVEQLIAYSRKRDAQHFPAWAHFNAKLARRRSVGIWHETYIIRPGEYECIYGNMPPFGLAKAAQSVVADGSRQTSTGRLGRSDGQDAPLDLDGRIVEK